ncbi:MAG TPA: FUSC family protein, partial [Stellaceae bacterium]|nr:FUSC family protein [Stellaceae bacterium]
RRLAEEALAERLRLAAAMLRKPGAARDRDLAKSLRESVGEIGAWLHVAGVEKTSPADDLAALRQAAASTQTVLMLAEVASAERADRLPDADRIAARIDGAASILSAGRRPRPGDVHEAIEDEAPSPRANALSAGLARELDAFAERPTADAQHHLHTKTPGGFFLPDAFTNPDHVYYALKTTCAAVFCYVLYSLLDWPGIHTCFITCYIVSLTTTAETVEKLTLRVLGCLVGAATGIAAIVYLMPDVTSITGLMAVVFGAAFVSAWIAGGSPRIAYAGFQVAFAFFLCVVQGSAPAFDMKTARDRAIGILVGNVVAYLFSIAFRSVSVGRRIDPAIAGLLRTLGLMATADQPIRRQLAAETQASLGILERDLALVFYEPVSIRPSRAWLEARVEAARQIGALAGRLLLPEAPEPGLAGAAARLERLADSLDGADKQPVADSGRIDDADELHAFVCDPIRKLERTLGPAAGQGGMASDVRA